METVYEIPIIPNNLRNEETIVQISDVLTHLCDICDDILNKINLRLEKNKTHLENLKIRINNSSEKISKLTGTKKATQVFSSSKYPGTDTHKNYKSIFSINDNRINITRTKMKYKNASLNDHPLEKLQYYHVKMNNQLKNKLKYKELEDGLGSFPENIEFVNELLLFNTSKNPYRNYVMSDPLQSIQYIREADESTVSGPDAAPLSISHRAALNRSIGENYFYSPGLGNVPSIDVPLDLPDLPGVADDLRYLLDTDQAIAPSVTTTPVVPELPSIVQSPNEVPINPANTTETLPLPPLPPPAIEQILIMKQDSDDTIIDKYKDVSFSPTPIVVEDSEITLITSTESKKPKSLPVVKDSRASLMEAIRQAGGAKSAKLRHTNSTKNSDKPTGSGNNLMADLNAKLALRRKGISGSKTENGTEVNSAFSKISDIIPPPPATDLNESTNTEDDDWDDDD